MGTTLEDIDILHKERYGLASNYIIQSRKLIGRIADVGCGVGYGSYIISQYLNILMRSYSIHSFDISKEAIDIANSCYSDKNVTYNQVDCRVDSLSKIPEFENKFDAIVCFEFLEHLDLDESKKLLDFLLSKSDVLISSFPIDNDSSFHKIKFNKKEIDNYYEEAATRHSKKILNKIIQDRKYYIFIIGDKNGK